MIEDEGCQHLIRGHWHNLKLLSLSQFILIEDFNNFAASGVQTLGKIIGAKGLSIKFGNFDIIKERELIRHV